MTEAVSIVHVRDANTLGKRDLRGKTSGVGLRLGAETVEDRAIANRGRFIPQEYPQAAIEAQSPHDSRAALHHNT